MTGSGGWRIPVIFAAACVAVRVAAYAATGYQVDDALITFRYAENLAAGNGFVYNLGEHVLGTTTPLFTLLLAAFGALGASVPFAAIAISLAASAGTVCTLIRFGERSGFEKYACLSAILYTLYPRSVICDISGLETALFTFLLVVSLYKLYSRDYLAASAIASMAALTRPEGIGLILLVLAVAAIERADHDWRLLIAPIVIVGGWLSFSLVYFGSLLPNSMLAKAALYDSSAGGFLSRLGEMMTLGWPWGDVAFGAAVGVLVWLIAQRDRLVLPAVVAIVYVVALALSSPRIFFWYSAPVLPLLFLIVATPLKRLLLHERSRIIPAVLAIAAVLALSPLIVSHVARLDVEMLWYQTNHIAAAEYLNVHAQPGDKVLAEDIGHFGYHYRGDIIDRDGLVTPQAVDYNGRGAYREFVDSVNADWIFLAVEYPSSKALRESPDFGREYEEVAFAPANIRLTHHLFKQR